jgi:hypothetical protein
VVFFIFRFLIRNQRILVFHQGRVNYWKLEDLIITTTGFRQIKVHRFPSPFHREPASGSRKPLSCPFNTGYLCFIKPKKQSKMKASTILIAAVFALSVNVLFANSKRFIETPVTLSNSSISITSLAPATPGEADFEDAVVVNELAALAPVAPAEATFEEIPYEMQSIIDLAPSTPAVADFDDAAEILPLDLVALAPVTPAEADFE